MTPAADPESASGFQLLAPQLVALASDREERAIVVLADLFEQILPARAGLLAFYQQASRDLGIP